MTDQEMLKKLETDPKYFIETFLWIVDKDRKSRRLTLNPPQQGYYEARTKNDLILKARKEGFSTLIEALFLHDCIFGKNINCVTMSHTLEDTLIHLDRVRHFLDTMGGDLGRCTVSLDKNNQRELFFPESNSRYWIGTAGSRAFGRGRDVTHLHLSEVAHYEKQDVLTGVMEACVPEAYKVLETTANGLEIFYRMWKEAGDPQSGSPWRAHFFAWYEDPSNCLPVPQGITFRPTSEEGRMQKEYKLSAPQLNWWRAKRAGMADKSKMPQENPSNAEEAFIFSGRHVFDLARLKDMENEIKVADRPWMGDLEDDGARLMPVKSDEGYLTIYRHPRHGRQYLVAADVAEGIAGGDWSVAQVLDRSSWEQVAVLRLHCDPGSFGTKLVELGYYYNNAVLAPELNNHGWATVERIKADKYPHLLNTREIWDQETPRDGFPMLNHKIKGMVITALRNAVDDRTVPIHHLVTVQELQTFIEKEGILEAMKDCHDDCVTSLAIGIYCLKFLSVEETYADRVPRSGPAAFATRDEALPARRNRAGY